MKRRNQRLTLAGSSAIVVAVVAFFAIAPVGSALTNGLSSGIKVTIAPKLSLKYRSVSDDPGDCGDFGLGLPCVYCEFTTLLGHPTGGSLGSTKGGKAIYSVCTDVLTAVGAKQTWHAFYHFSTRAGIGGVNINETSGTLNAGESMQFVFGLNPYCKPAYAGNVVSIEGPYNTVFIGYSGCG